MPSNTGCSLRPFVERLADIILEIDLGSSIVAINRGKHNEIIVYKLETYL